MTTETMAKEAQSVSRVVRATQELNEAIAEAARLNIRVEVDTTLIHREIGRSFSRPIVQVTVSKILN